MIYYEVQLIKNWYKSMRGLKNIIEAINGIKNVNSIGFTLYKTGQKSDMKLFLNGHLTMPINITYLFILLTLKIRKQKKKKVLFNLSIIS